MTGQEAPYGYDRPYSQPVKWAYWEKRFNKPIPYESPTAEFVHNLYLPTMHELMSRWEGLNKEDEIIQLYESHEAQIERYRVQMIRKRSYVPDVTDPKDVAADTFADIQIIQSRIDALVRELNQGYHVVVETTGSLTEGFTRREIPRPLTSRAIYEKEKSIREFMETKRLLREQSTSITEVRENTGMRDQIRDIFSEINHTAGGFTWEQIQAAKRGELQLESATVDALEGEVIELEKAPNV